MTPRTLLAGLAALLVLLLAGAGPAVAEPPPRLADPVTDRAGVGLDPGVAEAVAALRDATGTQLFVVYVDSFDGASGQQWADEAARRSQLGDDDVLFAVAVDDRAYGYSTTGADDRIAEVLRDDVEPRLAVGDWSGAAVALADGLRGGDGGGIGIGTVVVGIAAVGGGVYLLTRRRRARARTAEPPTAPGPTTPEPDEFPGVATDELAYRASTALIEVDDAVRTSEQELAAARAQYGDAAVAGFAAALQRSRTDMMRAFEIRQRLDDDRPEDEPTARRMYAEIVRTSTAADERLDAQSDAFDRLRDLETRAPDYLAGLGSRHAAAAARLPAAEAERAALAARYAPSALAPDAGNLEQARRLLDAAAVELTAARAALDGGDRSAAVVSGRAAEDAVTQADALLDGPARLAAALADAAARFPAARAETEQDLAEARALLAAGGAGGSGGAGEIATTVGGAAARTEAALATATRLAEPPPGALPDPLGALRHLLDADAVLDAALAAARDAAAAARRAAAALEQALLTARSAVAAAEDFVASRRGAVGPQARTRLAEAQRHLQRAAGLAGTDPVTALTEARSADGLARAALQDAQSDLAAWSAPAGPSVGGRIAADLGSLVLSGILAGATGSHRRGGGFGGGFGGRSPGSFGGTATRARRGGGGRF